MKLRKGHKAFIYITAFLGVLFLMALFFQVFILKGIKQRKETLEMIRKEGKVQISQAEAIDKVKEFCNRLDLHCMGEPFIENYFPLGEIYSDRYLYDRRHCFSGGSYKPLGVYIAMNDKKAVSEGLTKDPYIKKPYIFFIVGKLKEVELYINRAIYDLYRFKKYSERHDFMPEEKAFRIFNPLAKKLEIPKDMVFDKMEKDKQYGTWNAYWLRKKDGYWYEGDAITISIMGTTGEFIAYTKTYRGTPIPTEVNISKEKALEIAWEKLRENSPRKVKERVKELYEIDGAELLIMQATIFKRRSIPVTFEGSRLAWVIKYYFTGGIVYHGPPVEKPMNLFTKEERKEYEVYLGKKDEKWQETGLPRRDFEVRIDALTGEIFYLTKLEPWYLRWMAK